MSRVEREDPPVVRARKWAQRWEWEELACFWSACCGTDEDGWIRVLPWNPIGHLGPQMRAYSGAPVARARALLWRREVAMRVMHRKTLADLEKEWEERLWAESMGEDL